jgi:hypothetical protein
VIHSEISAQIRPYLAHIAAPETVRNTEVAILVDISSSMTKFSKQTLISAQILSTGIGSVLGSFGVPIQFLAFAGREEIWKLADADETEIRPAIFRIVDALRTGNRPGSYPLDAMLTVYDNGKSAESELQIISLL